MGERLPTTITFLEMRAQSVHRPTPPFDLAKGRVAVLKADNPPIHFYRYLYDAVGSPWHWVDRKRLSDAELGAIIHDPKLEIFVLYVEGCPAGYAELDFRGLPTADLAYFGLMPEYLGRRLGAFFLSTAISTMWSKGAERLKVNTCTLDHPRALPLYQQMGFTPYAQREAFVELLD
jgi:GNAT superfamily N-acetyltransferase